ncbi:MAG: helicase [Betaproteobacteria bacterium RIFCSPLOWO2_12_FULL_65_110]|nr:MAG: helicase [Betaproteobacteria bacterium RIFCSPLOWO2_12_FULL_65_110]
MALILKKEPRLGVKMEGFAYQVEAVEAVRNLEYAAIFHEQGLGKTKIAVDLLLYWIEKGIVDTVLLVAKKGLVANWQRELKAHAYIRPLTLTGDRRRNFYVFNSPTRLILTHYEVVKAEKERLQLFLKTRSVGIILDEATKIKNPDSELTQAFLEVRSLFKRRVIMTGTPVANRPYDLWAQIRFLDGGVALGNDYEDFRRKLDLSNDLGDDQAAQDAFEGVLRVIHDRLAPFAVRETKQGGVIQLPEKIVTRLTTEWEPRQFELYTQVRTELRAAVVKNGIPTEDDSERAIKRLLRLVQIASNPALVDESYTIIPGKWEPLEELVDTIIVNDEKCIIWTTFTDNADWLARKLQHYSATKVHGKLSMEQRNRAVTLFLDDPDCKVLVATPGAAKEGLTLTVANHVIFYDRGFSLDDYLQAQDRIHRVSQVKTCHVYNLIMRDSIDEWIDVLLQAKRLAAQLAQGDISYDYYKSQMTYSYGDLIRKILGINKAKA